jgi:hypothetical protein
MSAEARRKRRPDTILQKNAEPLPFSFYNIVKGIGRRPLDMGFGKSSRGLLLPRGNVKVIQCGLFLFNLFDVGDSQLHCINVSRGEGVTTAEKDRTLTPSTVAQAKPRNGWTADEQVVSLHL